MCHYCGCRQMPLIRDYVAEHERVTDLAGDALRAVDHGDPTLAGRLVSEMAAELRAHWRGEENGIFRVMGREEEYAAYIEPLVAEHRELADLLSDLDLADADDLRRFRVAVAELHEHISKEEDGLFPAALTALGGEDWNSAMAAWQDAHPERTPIPD